ncbi:MAG: hypothetical protein ACRDLB_08575 [Actinomycetota bacterium]
MISGRTRNLACSLGVLLLVGAAPLPALAETAKPAVSSYAWYWETQQSQVITDPTSGADVATIEAPNPFCPSTSVGGPPEQAGTCKGGRLPVEVQAGDYETPDKISAVAFDLSLIPIGSTITKFEATFLEAQDDQSKSVNAEGQSLQACLVEQFFGDGEARLYKEAPRFSCSKSDPVAKRKAVEVKTNEGKVERFQYKFDLTRFARSWADAAPVAAIMLFPAEPKEADFDPATDNNWRVVLDGPQEKNSIVTKAVFDPPAEDELDELDDLDDLDDLDTTGSSDGFDTGTTDSFDSGSSDVAGSDTAAGAPATDTATEDPLATSDDELAGESTAATGTQGLPGYMWLALLAGLVGFFLFRSVVLESTAGIRPDGVLAQIRQINATRRGTTVEPEQTVGLAARLAPLSHGFKRVGGAASVLKNKIPFVNRKA